MNENSALFQVVSSSLAEALVQDRPQHAALFKSTQEEKQKLQAEIEKKLELFAVTLKEGAFQLLKNGTADEACLKDFEKLAIFSRELSNEKARLYFEKMVSEGKSLIELSGFSDETLESFYKTAKELYDQKQYESAKAAFTYLALLDPSRYPFWLGLAQSAFCCHAYENALVAFAFAIQIDPSDPLCHLYSSRCYEALLEWDNALNALDIALYVLEHNGGAYAEWKPRIKSERERLLKLIKK